MLSTHAAIRKHYASPQEGVKTSKEERELRLSATGWILFQV